MLTSLVRVVVAFAASFFAGMFIAPTVIKLTKKLKASQTVLGYVEQHSYKSGTPTMGGFIFILPVIAVSLIFAYGYFTLLASAVVFSYAVIGFLDDFIKVKFKQNLGLRTYQKLVAQLGIAVIISVACYNSRFIGSEIYVPFTNTVLDLKWWYIPFVVIAFVGLTNAVNLTDGLDGLASSVGLVCFITFGVILYVYYLELADYGKTQEAAEILNLTVFSTAFAGGLLAFLWFNSNPAKIMMGDMGSLSIGGAIAVVSVFSKNPLLSILVGITYLWSCISVVVQVIYFKLTKKRVFLMAPFHHHLEMKGVQEQKIVWWYVIFTIIFSAAALLA
jgi:phospho-N-acetylmuramoyl-pentapeptide-transferase